MGGWLNFERFLDGPIFGPRRAGGSGDYDSSGSKSRDEEKIVLKELVPMLACLNPIGVATSLL